MDKKFMDFIKENIKAYLPDTFMDASVEIEETLKNNDLVRQGLMICRRGESITPKIYLEDYEKRYKKGESFEQILQEIAELRVLLDCKDTNILPAVMDYASLKQNLTFSMCDPELNHRKMQEYVHTPCGKYAAMYRLVLMAQGEGVASMPITKEHLKVWKVTEEQLYKDTIQAENRRGFELMSMREMVKEITSHHTEESFEAANLLGGSENVPVDDSYVLSNRIRYFGAGAIMHSELLERIGKLLGRDYFILPSCVHELFIIPDVGNQSQEELERRIWEINETENDPEEIFSYHAVFYDHDQKLLLPEKPNEKQHDGKKIEGNNYSPFPLLN